MSTTIVKDGLRRVKDALDRLNIGKNPNDLSMHLATLPNWGATYHRELEHRVNAIDELLRVTGDVYADSLVRPELGWIRDAFEAPLGERARRFSRAAASQRASMSGVTHRPDFIDFEKIAEVQVQGAGLGLLVALENVFRGRTAGTQTRLVALHAEAIRRRTRKANPRVLMLAHDYGLRETAFYCACLNRLGLRADAWDVSDQSVEFRSSDYDLILWKGGLDELLANPALLPVFAEVEDNGRQDLFAPGLSCLRLSKMNLVLPFLPETRARFSDAVRDLLPKTDLLSAGLGASLLELSGSQRRKLLIKYAGQAFSATTGSRGVRMLGRSTAEDHRALSGIERAPESSPWLVQTRVRSRFDVTYLHGDELVRAPAMSARLNPRLVVDGAGTLRYGGTVVMFSTDFKCHGGEENAITWVPPGASAPADDNAALRSALTS